MDLIFGEPFFIVCRIMIGFYKFSTSKNNFLKVVSMYLFSEKVIIPDKLSHCSGGN